MLLNEGHEKTTPEAETKETASHSVAAGKSSVKWNVPGWMVKAVAWSQPRTQRKQQTLSAQSLHIGNFNLPSQTQIPSSFYFAQCFQVLSFEQNGCHFLQVSHACLQESIARRVCGGLLDLI